jgi:hypothetical protein
MERNMRQISIYLGLTPGLSRASELQQRMRNVR